jgi:hypothetical protein
MKIVPHFIKERDSQTNKTQKVNEMFQKRKIGLSLLGGRILTNLADSILYILIVWIFNEQFSSPILLSLVFMTTSIIDSLSVFLGPIVDRTKPKFNLYFMSLLQVISVAVLLVVSFLMDQTKFAFNILLLVFLLIVYTASSMIYPSGSKLIPVIAKENGLVQVNSLFRTTEKVLDVTFNAVSTVIITFLKLDHILIIILCLFYIATRLYRLVDKGMRSTDPVPTQETDGYTVSEYLTDLRDGIREVKYHPDVLWLFLPLTVLNLFYGIAAVGLPIISGAYISDKAYGYGSLLMCSSIGGVLGAMLIGKFAESVNKPKKYACIFLMIAGVSWLFIPITMPFFFLLSYPLIFISNCAINMMNVMFLSLIQKQIDLSLLGRVSTFTESLVSVMVPIGNFLCGFLLLVVSPLCAELLYGIALILCSAAYLVMKTKNA